MQCFFVGWVETQLFSGSKKLGHDPAYWTVACLKGDHEDTLRPIDKAISVDEQRVNLTLDRALTKLALRDFSGAILDCDAALAFSARDPDKAQGERDSAISREHREKARRLMAEAEMEWHKSLKR